MDKNTKRKLVAGAAAAVAVAGGGAAIGATQFGSPKQESAAVVSDAAQQLGVTPTQLSDALKKAIENQIDAAVAAGRLTQAQGDALKAKVESGDVPLFALPALGFGGKAGLGFGAGLKPLGAALDAAAAYLGITTAQLRTELAGGKTLAQIATGHGKTAEGLVQALYDAQKKQLDALVTAGKLTQSQEDAILADMKQRITDLVNGKVTLHDGPHSGRFGFGFGFGANLDAAATYLGLTEAQLQTQLASGKTLAQIATAQGKTAEGLVNAMYDAQKKQVDAAVAAGTLTQSQADAILANAKQRITALVNGTLPAGPRFGGPGMPGMRGFRGGFRGFPGPSSSQSGTATA
jgi:polyhydroxyalkanoate synthesis regulator phasin